MLIEMFIKGLMIDPVTNMPIVILRDEDGAADAADLGWARSKPTRLPCRSRTSRRRGR